MKDPTTLKPGVFDKVMDKAPWFVRVVFWTFWGGAIIMFNLFMTGFEFREYTRKEMHVVASEVFDQRSAPLKAARDQQMIHIDQRLDTLDRKADDTLKVLYNLEGSVNRALATK